LAERRNPNPDKVKAGRAAALKRWGAEPRVIRLDDLTAPQRRLVIALVNAARKEAAADDQGPAAASAEGHGNDRSAA
jgi:hypothetical protein